MFIGFLVLFVMPIAICLGALIVYDYIKKVRKFRKNQTKKNE